MRAIIPKRYCLVLARVMVLGIGLLCPTRATCQADTNPDALKGLPSYITFGGLNENINLTTGNLNLRLPLLKLPGRAGHDVELAIVYNTKQWELVRNVYPGGEYWYWKRMDDSVWTLNLPVMMARDTTVEQLAYWPFSEKHCTAANFTARLDGKLHWFANRNGCSDSSYSAVLSDSDDASFLRLDTSAYPLAILYNKNGTQYHFQFPPGGAGMGTGAFNAKEIDSNGNRINYDYDWNAGTIQITDTLARRINVTYAGSNYSSLTYKDSSGQDQSIIFGYSNVVLNPSFQNPTWGNAPSPQTVPLLTTITFPNGRTINIEYNNFGEITKVTYPTGGYTRYVYGVFPHAWHRWANGVNQPFTAQFTFGYAPTDFRQVVERRVCSRYGGDCAPSEEEVTTYQPTVSATQLYNKFMDVTGPDGNRTRYEFSSETVPNITRFFSPREVSRTMFQGNSVPLGTITMTYSDLSPFGSTQLWSLPTSETRVLNDTNQTSKTEMTYDTFTALVNDTQFIGSPLVSRVRSMDNPVEKREFDFGSGQPGPLKRTTISSWLKTNPINGVDYQASGIHILDKLASQEVRDDSGAVRARVEYVYDSYPTGLVSTGAVQKEATFNTNLAARGNVTAERKWRNTDNTYLISSFEYDDAGNKRKILDPLQHATLFDYADSWGNSSCQPAGGSAAAYLKNSINALNHMISYSYNSCTGSISSFTDENGLATHFSVYDSMNRLRSKSTPDGALVSIVYNETALPVSIVESRSITSSSNFVSRVTLDGLGRESVTSVESDPQGPTFVDIAYDAMGRKKSVTNTHRTSPGATDGTTFFCYDALGRVSTVTPPGGTAPALDCSGGSNLIRTAYSGSSTTVTDQTGKQRRSYSDALGRLIRVDEPGGGGPATGSSGSATVISVNADGTVQTQGLFATGAVTINSFKGDGTVQSQQSQTASATQSSGSITVNAPNGGEQSTQVQTAPATSGTGSVTFGAANAPVWGSYEVWGCVLWDESGGCMEEGWVEEWGWFYDTGSVTVYINGYPKTTAYSSSNTPAQIAGALASAMNSDANFPAVADWPGGATIYFTSKAVGASSNYVVGGYSYSDNPEYFDPASFTPSPTGLSGGANAQYSTVYDSGTVTVTVNAGPNQVVAQANFGQNSTTSTIAADLRTSLNNSSLLIASGSGATINLTSEAAGLGTNYSLATSWTYNTNNFGSPSFTASKSGNNMTGGSDAQYTTVYDSGLVTITVNGVPKQVGFGQGSTRDTIASALASAIHSDAAYPADASANGATINLTARTAGTAGNYNFSASATYNAQFAQASFSTGTSGSTLVGGQTLIDAGTVTLNINSGTCPAFVVNYGSGSTRDSVAAALRSAVNGNGPCTVTAGGTGNAVTLTSDATGAGVNFALSGASASAQGFTPASFSLTTSGMSGGADYTPGTLATPSVTLYSYDVLNNLNCAVQKGTDASSFTTCATAPPTWRPRSFVYNSLSQLIEAVNPESGRITYAHDPDGNVMSRTSPAPNQTNPSATTSITYAYDPLHRLVTKNYSNTAASPDVSYFYDQTSFNGLAIANGKGRRTGMSDASGATAWTYEVVPSLGWKTTERRTINGVTKAIVYQNNLAGSLAQLTNPSGTVLSYGYDSAGRTNHVSSPVTTYVQSAQYLPHGAVETLGSNSGSVVSHYFYNERLQICRAHVRTSGSAPTSCGDTSTAVGNVMDLRYHYGIPNDGNVAQIENKRHPERTQVFTYDELSRIRTAKTQISSGSSSWGLLFGYDSWANLLSAEVTQGSVSTLSVAVSQSNQIVGYCYDAAGNLLNEGACGGTAAYAYDAENRLVAAGGVGYVYDGDGKRVVKSNGKLYWTGTGADPLAESDAAGNISDEFVFFNGRRLARRDSSGNIFYYFTDHLGSTRVVLQAGQSAPCSDGDYLPFGGEQSPIVNTCAQNYKFTGKERDPESQLDYFNVRHYSHILGRFLSPDEFSGGPVDAFSVGDPLPPGPLPYADAANPQSLNKYTYVYNNPLLYVDPSGHQAQSIRDELNRLWDKAKRYVGLLFAAQNPDAEGTNRRDLEVVRQDLPGHPGHDMGDVLVFTDQQVKKGVDTLVRTIQYVDVTGYTLALGTLTGTTTQGEAFVGLTLNIASGARPLKGAINLDISLAKGVDVVGDMLKLPFARNSFTHVAGQKVPSFFFGIHGNDLARELFRVLKPGGQATLTCASGFAPNVVAIFKKAGFTSVTVEGNFLRVVK